MKEYKLILIALFSSVISLAQNSDPYAVFGHTSNVVYKTAVTEMLYIKNSDSSSIIKAMAFDIDNNTVKLLGSNDKVLEEVNLEVEQLLRWLSTDPLAKKYPQASPYNFVLNNPINAVDPDGRLVLFFNGQHSGLEGGTSGYWAGVDQKIMNRLGDHHSMYRDGAMGGFPNTLFAKVGNNLDASNRMKAGYVQGIIDARNVINSLQRDPNDPNHITESVKMVSHSMGTAYSRGYENALNGYVNAYNKDNPGAPLTGFKLETQVDIAAFQGSSLPSSGNFQNRLFMSGDQDLVANGSNKGWGYLLNLGPLSPNSDVSGAKSIPTLPGTGHGVAGYGNDSYINQIPSSNNNPSSPSIPNTPITPSPMTMPSDNTRVSH